MPEVNRFRVTPSLVARFITMYRSHRADSSSCLTVHTTPEQNAPTERDRQNRTAKGRKIYRSSGFFREELVAEKDDLQIERFFNIPERHAPLPR